MTATLPLECVNTQIKHRIIFSAHKVEQLMNGWFGIVVL